jgi:SAM-dependent methyltransferase
METKYAEFYDPRLVAVYNTVCALDGYEKFYIELAKKLNAETILDIGCGTGLLTCELTKAGFTMIGIEPAKHMLDIARKSPCGKTVQWIEGDALALKAYNADLVIMTGHVAQFHIDDTYWQKVLSAIYKALRPGGYLAFESRNPAVQPWFTKKEHQDWHSIASPRKSSDPVEGPLETWSEPIKIEGERVTFKGHYLFKNSGEELVTINELVFRTKEELVQSLEKAGFLVEHVYGFWDWSPASIESPEFIFVATKK